MSSANKYICILVSGLAELTMLKAKIVEVASPIFGESGWFKVLHESTGPRTSGDRLARGKYNRYSLSQQPQYSTLIV